MTGVQTCALPISVSIGGARVHPNDIMRGDSDGVIVIPKEHEDKVLEAAEAIEAAEDKIRAALKSGMRLDEARQLNQYHHLQSRED